MPAEYQPLVTPPTQRKEPALWFAFHRGELLIAQTADEARLPRVHDVADLGVNAVRSLYLGTYDGEHCYVCELEHANDLPAGHAMHGLRESDVNPDPFAQFDAWFDASHRFHAGSRRGAKSRR